MATGQTHQCASKFDMGLYRAWVTACPPPQKKRFPLVWAEAFSLWVSRERRPSTSISSQTRTSHGKRMRERTKPLPRWSCTGSNPRRTKRCFAQDTCVCFWLGERPSSRALGIAIRDGYRWSPVSLVCCKSSHQRSQSRCLWRRVRKAQANTEASRDGDFKQVKADCDGDYKRAK